MIQVREIMTPNPLTLRPQQSLADARRLMSDHHIRHVPIVDAEGMLAGLVTERDVLAAMDSVLDPQKTHSESNVPIRSFMKVDPVEVDVQESLRGAALFMEKHRYGCLPVTDEGKLCGIITDSDYVALAINLLEQVELSEAD